MTTDDTWQVTVDALFANSDPEPDALDELLDMLAEHEAAVAGRGQELGVTLTITAQTAAQAVADGVDKVTAAAKGQGLGRLEVLAGEAVRADEADRRLAEPTIPELVGPPEAAEILNVSRQRVHQLAADRSDFPQPLVVTKTTSLWTRASIEAFSARWKRREGRPPKYFDVVEHNTEIWLARHPSYGPDATSEEVRGWATIVDLARQWELVPRFQAVMAKNRFRDRFGEEPDELRRMWASA